MRHVFVDETKRAGYVIAAVTVTDPVVARKVVRSLIVPGRRRVHMHNEHVRRRQLIVSTLVSMPIAVTIYDAARRYRTDLDARAACLASLVEDLSVDDEVRLVIEQDDSHVPTDRHELYRLVRQAGIAENFEYRHQRAYEEPLLALADVAAWSWVRSGDWRRRITPILVAVRQV